jgi:hypothetical protein
MAAASSTTCPTTKWPWGEQGGEQWSEQRGVTWRRAGARSYHCGVAPKALLLLPACWEHTLTWTCILMCDLLIH